VTSYPKFAVVGHPNKGKSSIVASLSLDDTIQISDTSGTTKRSRSFPLIVDGKIIYELYDTPGFQRARKVLAWLKQKDVSADKKASVLREFVYQHIDDEKYSDEIELLKPIIEGASIIYVVDGSKPYSPEYEAQMEILRWSSQPSMALINLIGDDDYIEQWRLALGQYFRLVRVYNPMKANYKTHIAILKSISQLKEEWVESMESSIEIFKQFHKQKIDNSVELISDTLIKIITYINEYQVSSSPILEIEIDEISKEYKADIIKFELEFQDSINKIWNHKNIFKDNINLNINEVKLFSKESKSIFGLNKKDLISTGAMSGAIVGSGIDILSGGATMLLGLAMGGVIGGVSTALGMNKLMDIKILGKSIGSNRVKLGPIKDMNFIFIVLSRVIYYTEHIATRSHALQNGIELSKQSNLSQKYFNRNSKKELNHLHKKIQDSYIKKDKIRDEYKKRIRDIVLEFKI